MSWKTFILPKGVLPQEWKIIENFLKVNIWCYCWWMFKSENKYTKGNSFWALQSVGTFSWIWAHFWNLRIWVYKWFSTNFYLCLLPVNCAIPLLNIHVHLGALLRLSENLVWRNGLLMGLLDSTSGEKFWDFHLHSWSLPSENVCLLENIFLNTHVFTWPSYSTRFWSNCV